MALRRQVPEDKAVYPDPRDGVNLRTSQDDLKPGEARKMQNLVYDGGTRSRTGSRRLTPNSLGNYAIKGGYRYYFGGPNPQSLRLVAYNTNVSVVDGTGTEFVKTTGMTANRDTFFTTWTITDKLYIGNDTDTLRSYDGNSNTFSTVVGTNIPVARTGVCPILDRLMCITTNGIERCNPRDPTVWSQNSSWATIRPQQPGFFTQLVPYTIRGLDTIYPGLIAFQPNAYYLITGSDFGADVTSVTPTTTEDSSIKLLDPAVGCSSPYGTTVVPGVGMFWFTTNLNVYWLPEGSLTGSYVGDKIQSVTTQLQGTESTNQAALSQVWMSYYYPFIMLGIPTGSDIYPSVQWWLDIRAFPQRVVWYGPMIGQTVGRVWTEMQNGDNAIFAGEGNSATGAWVYQLRVPLIFSDAVGGTDTDITRKYQTYFPDFGWPSRQKYLQEVNFDMYLPAGSATLNLYDLDETLATNIPIVSV